MSRWLGCALLRSPVFNLLTLLVMSTGQCAHVATLTYSTLLWGTAHWKTLLGSLLQARPRCLTTSARRALLRARRVASRRSVEAAATATQRVHASAWGLTAAAARSSSSSTSSSGSGSTTRGQQTGVCMWAGQSHPAIPICAPGSGGRSQYHHLYSIIEEGYGGAGTHQHTAFIARHQHCMLAMICCSWLNQCDLRLLCCSKSVLTTPLWKWMGSQRPSASWTPPGTRPSQPCVLVALRCVA